ncbi:hypothetical protein CW362_18195 [Streptomyces populi]|uniref:Uncharacterized protein n=1 Tax=Streptomyces populi TaxID=2058924 RepID=A0A2I0SNV7_9ACTN|nr:hypothetical protein CW362_18195 [Streptomyces populi]
MSLFPEENEEVADGLGSYESTRCARWPANSFMVSVTDPGAGRGCLLTPLRCRDLMDEPRTPHPIWLDQNAHDTNEESRSWTSFAPRAGRRRSPPRPSTPPPCRSRAAPM